MTTHPTDRLADLVDGTLTGPDRDELVAHVQACPRCVAEVRAAGDARAALRGLAAPSTPLEIGERAVAQARRTADAGRARNPWAKTLPALGVAAALVLAVALFLPRIGGDGDTEVPVAADAAGPSASRATSLEVIDQDFDAAGVAALAAPDAPTEAAPTAEDGTTAGGVAVSDTTRPVGPALDCLTQAFRGLPGTPVRVLQARFLHEPAYLAVLESGPGAGLPADRRYVLVATKDDCTARSQYSENIP